MPNSSMHELLIHEAHGVVEWHILVLPRLYMYYMNTFYLPKKKMYKKSMINTLHIAKLSLRSYRMICILLCLYLKNLRQYFYRLCFRFTDVKKG
jgi:hypothetical protein